MENLNSATFIEKVFDFKNAASWRLEEGVPVIIDFYADWCGPSRITLPLLEELQEEYSGQIVVYRVNAEQEPELATAFNLQHLPSFLFVPVGDEPQMVVGAMPKRSFSEVIREVLLQKKQLEESA